MTRERICWVLPLLLASTGAAWADTDLRIYGYADVSVDEVDNGLRTMNAVSSNLSYIGFAAQHDITDDIKVVAQIEGEAAITSTPSLRDTFGFRNSYLGFASKEWGTIKVGKNDTPYKTATASFDPFSGGIADYNSIMGNTGGDGRAEFDQRANHAIWYESPQFGGLTFSFMYAPGQNSAGDSSNFPLGDNTCTGSVNGGNGSGNAGVQNGFGTSFAFPGGPHATPFGASTIGTGFAECTDGAFGDLYSTSAVYKRGGFTGIAAAELHHAVNRLSDVVPGGNGNLANLFNATTIDGSFALSTATEWAAKVGGGYDFGDVKVYAIAEYMRRTQVQTGFNERTRYGVFGAATWRFMPKDEVAFSYAHAFSTPGNPGVTTAVNFLPGANGVPGTGHCNLGDATQDNQSDQFGIGVRHYFTPAITIYAEVAYLHNHDCAHYGLGPSGHGLVYLQRNQFNETFPGKDLAGISMGSTFRF
jgi:predicted porin